MIDDSLKCIAALAIGYLIGSLNTAVIVGRVYGKDVRDYGSKSAGLTNTLRVLGKSAALCVLCGDILKGVVACLVGADFDVNVYSGEARDCVSLLAAGLGAVVGHNWPTYFRFKGGKGALTAVAVLFMVDWLMAALSLGLFAIIVTVTRYVSLGTICSSVFFALIAFLPIFTATIYFHVFALLMVIILVLKHRENIRRLVSGTESKLKI